MTDRLDEAIDRAVREMLEVEPRPDLRARIVERIETRRRGGPRTTPPLRWLVAPLAAAALIAAAVFVARRSEPVPQAPIVATAPDRRLPAPPRVSTAEPPEQPARPVVAAPRPVRQAGGTVAAASFAGEASAAAALAPLKTIAPIAVEPIAHDTIAPAEVAVRPLNTISDVQIAPLTPPDRR
jgi:hypothetical protein